MINEAQNYYLGPLDDAFPGIAIVATVLDLICWETGCVTRWTRFAAIHDEQANICMRRFCP
jgi:hypothetical protein